MNLDNIDKERVNQSSVDLEQWKKSAFGGDLEATRKQDLGGGVERWRWMDELSLQLRKTIGKTW